MGRPSLRFPGRSAALNASHPAMVKRIVATAAVGSGNSLQGSGGMLDLVSGVVATNTTLQGGQGAYGPYVVAKGAGATSLIGWTIPAFFGVSPLTTKNYGFMGIIRAGVHHSNQGWVSFNNISNQISSTSVSMSLGAGGVTLANTPATLGHTFFVYADVIGQVPGFWRFCVMDLDSGVMNFTRTNHNNIAQVITGLLNAISGPSGTPDEGQICVISHLINPPNTAAWLSDAEIIAWAHDPWSLHYGPPDLNASQSLAFAAPSSNPPPPVITGGNAVALTTAHPIPWRRSTPLHNQNGARSSRTVYQPGTVPLVTQRLKMTYTAGMALDRVVGFKLTVDNGTNGFTFTLRDRNTGDRFVFTHSGGHATNVAGSIATLSTECDLTWVFDGTNDSIVTLSFANIEFHPGHL